MGCPDSVPLPVIPTHNTTQPSLKLCPKESNRQHVPHHHQPTISIWWEEMLKSSPWIFWSCPQLELDRPSLLPAASIALWCEAGRPPWGRRTLLDYFPSHQVLDFYNLRFYFSATCSRQYGHVSGVWITGYTHIYIVIEGAEEIDIRLRYSRTDLRKPS